MDGEMLLDAEERLAYWGYKHMNVSCRDINDEDEPDITGLERILYGVGFLAVTKLTGIKAYEDDSFTDTIAEDSEADEPYTSYWDSADDEIPEYSGIDEEQILPSALAQPPTYAIDFEPDNLVFDDKSAAGSDKEDMQDDGEVMQDNEGDMQDEIDEASTAEKPSENEGNNAGHASIPIPVLVLEHMFLQKAR